MTEQTLKIEINRELADVFDYVIDPDHSPDWIDSFKSETATPWPPRVGTIYRNSNHEDVWTEYSVEAFKPERHFCLAQVGGNYHAEYFFSTPYAGATKIVYHEWVTSGTLDDPVSIGTFIKLKKILEAAPA